MLSKFILLVSLLLIGYSSANAIQKDDIYIYQPESLQSKYDGYNTTLKNDQQIEAPVSRYGRSNRTSQNLLMMDSARQLNQFQNNLDNYNNLYKDLFKQQDFASTDMRDLSDRFRKEFEQSFRQQNDLLKGLTSNSSNPYYQQRTFNADFNKPYQNKKIENQAAIRQGSADGYAAEQPILIRWFFSAIRYLRDNPLTSILAVLFVLGLFSVLQIVIRRLTRPFG